jgi:hypothetical protein
VLLARPISTALIRSRQWYFVKLSDYAAAHSSFLIRSSSLPPTLVQMFFPSSRVHSVLRRTKYKITSWEANPVSTDNETRLGVILDASFSGNLPTVLPTAQLIGIYACWNRRWLFADTNCVNEAAFPAVYSHSVSQVSYILWTRILLEAFLPDIFV